MKQERNQTTVPETVPATIPPRWEEEPGFMALYPYPRIDSVAGVGWDDAGDDGSDVPDLPVDPCEDP